MQPDGIHDCNATALAHSFSESVSQPFSQSDGQRLAGTSPNVTRYIERAGTRWEFSFTAQPGSLTITPRAADDQGNTQYPVSQQKWNQLGYLFGSMVPHPVGVTG